MRKMRENCENDEKREKGEKQWKTSDRKRKKVEKRVNKGEQGWWVRGGGRGVKKWCEEGVG